MQSLRVFTKMTTFKETRDYSTFARNSLVEILDLRQTFLISALCLKTLQSVSEGGEESGGRGGHFHK